MDLRITKTGMYYLMARYYNSDHDVFLSVDPDGHFGMNGI